MLAILCDLFRIRPVIIGNGRSLTSETVIGNYRIPEGVSNFFCQLYSCLFTLSTNGTIKLSTKAVHKICIENFWLQTHVIFPHYVVGNLEKYFPQAKTFIPERWLKADACPFGQNKIHRFASLPFGYGRRTCLGRRFAEAELKILLSKVLFRRVFRWIKNL